MWWWWAACGVDPAPTPVEASSTASTAETGLTPPPVVCAPTDNALRWSCVVSLDAPAAVTLEVRDGAGAPARVWGGGQVAAEHRFTVGFLGANTPYRWTATGGGLALQGDFTTGPLPAGASVRAEVEGTSTADSFAFVSPCPGAVAVVMTAAGEVVWYHDAEAELAGFAEALSVTDEGSVLLMTDAPDGLMEVGFDGVVRRVLGPDDLPWPTHHDAFRRHGLTHVLFARQLGAFRLDGVAALDDRGAVVATWFLGDAHQPDPRVSFDGDYSHANAVWVAADGGVWVSLRHLSAVLELAPAADPWPVVPVRSLTGDPDDRRLPSTMAREGFDFVRQHNAHRDGRGALWLFDNRLSPLEDSRVLEVQLDDTTGVATLTRAIDLGEHCPFQGGAWTTAAGHPVATCASSRVATEHRAGEASPAYRLSVSCASSEVQGYVPRVIPLDAALRPPGYEDGP